MHVKVYSKKHMTKYLFYINVPPQAFTERTQFIQGLAKALSWVQQQEKKALTEDHIALLPQDLAKQAAACRAVQDSFCAYRRELASLWLQGRELVRDATEKEKAETQTRLDQLQAGFETALQRTSQRLTDLEKALTSRKYFQVDLDKICHWLKEADAITFSEINLSKTDISELQTVLSDIHHVLEQASEYENLLLIVQRIGQEILPTLNEIDHCYLDERLNALPQQYNSILALAKEKRDRVQQLIFEQKDFGTFFGITRNALEELREQFDNLEKQTISVREEEFASLVNEYRNIAKSLFHFGTAVRQLCGKSEGLICRGQKCSTEETQQLVTLHNALKHTANQKILHFDRCLETVVEYNRVLTMLSSELKSVKEKLVAVQVDSDCDAVDKISILYSLLGYLGHLRCRAEECSQQIKGLVVKFDPAAFEGMTLQLKSLQSLGLEVKCSVEENETETTESGDFAGTEKLLEWLMILRDKLEKPLTFSEVKTERIYEEICKLNTVDEEVRTKTRIGCALCVREKQKYCNRKQAVPAHIEEKMKQMERLQPEVQQAIIKKKVCVFVLSRFHCFVFF